MKNIALALAIGLSSAGTAVAGPFGLEFGTPFEELDIAEITTPGRSFLFRSVPKPNSIFEVYYGKYAKGVGLCGTSAWSEIYDFNRLEEVRDHAVALKTALSKRYGEAISFTDTMFNNASTDLQPGYGKWMADWHLSRDQTSETGIQSLQLSIELLPLSEGPEILLRYDSDKMDDCREVWGEY